MWKLIGEDWKNLPNDDTEFERIMKEITAETDDPCPNINRIFAEIVKSDTPKNENGKKKSKKSKKAQ
jgi:hypothetical protein